MEHSSLKPRNTLGQNLHFPCFWTSSPRQVFFKSAVFSDPKGHSCVGERPECIKKKKAPACVRGCSWNLIFIFLFHYWISRPTAKPAAGDEFFHVPLHRAHWASGAEQGPPAAARDRGVRLCLRDDTHMGKQLIISPSKLPQTQSKSVRGAVVSVQRVAVGGLGEWAQYVHTHKLLETHAPTVWERHLAIMLWKAVVRVL